MRAHRPFASRHLAALLRDVAHAGHTQAGRGRDRRCMRLADGAVTDEADADRRRGRASGDEHQRPLDELLKTFQLIGRAIVAEPNVDEMTIAEAALVRDDLLAEAPARPQEYPPARRRGLGEVKLLVPLH